MTSINMRILAVIEQLRIKQVDFAKKLGISQAYVSKILSKNSTKTPSETLLKLICSEFNVNENWLRTGEGNMFNESDDLYELFGYAVNDMTDLEKEFLTKFLKLPAKERQMAIKYLRKLAAE